MNSAVIELIRPMNCLFTGVAVVIGGFVAAGNAVASVPGLVFVLAFLAAFSVAAGGNAINDYFDADADKVNRPNRPIPSGRMTAQEALRSAQILFMLGILISFFLFNVYCFVLAGLNSIVLILYSGFLKRRGLPGNLAIGYLVGSTLLFGGLATSVLTRALTVSLIPTELLILVLMAALSTVGRELIKAVQDMPGDRKSKLSTFPIRFGEKKAAILAAIFIAAAVILSPIPYLQGIFGAPYLYLLVPSIGSFVAAGFLIVAKTYSKTAAHASLASKLGMGFGLLAFLAGTISIL